MFEKVSNKSLIFAKIIFNKLINCPKTIKGFALFTDVANKRKATDKTAAQRAKNVKGVALKTHEGLCPSTLQAFEKA